MKKIFLTKQFLIKIYKNKKDSYKGNVNESVLIDENNDDWLKEIIENEEKTSPTKNIFNNDFKKKGKIKKK